MTKELFILALLGVIFQGTTSQSIDALQDSFPELQPSDSARIEANAE